VGQKKEGAPKGPQKWKGAEWHVRKEKGRTLRTAFKKKRGGESFQARIERL